jgi:hypothetical protein
MVLQNHVDQYCDHCTTTLVAIGTIDLGEYQCNDATMTEITAAIVTDLAAHGFTNILIKPFPHDPADRRLIIWGQHFDPAIHAQFAHLYTANNSMCTGIETARSCEMATEW